MCALLLKLHFIRLELLQLCNVVLTQNYFTFLSPAYLQNSGLAMGAPNSSIFSEIYLQYLEGTQLLDILIRHQIIGYFRYVDDILIIYNASTINIQTVFFHHVNGERKQHQFLRHFHLQTQRDF
jgi:hypothetical protein